MLKGHRLQPHCYTADDELRVIGTARSPALGPVIRCLVWNIYKARRRDWAEDFMSLVQDRDLVMLQEAVINAPSDTLFTDSQRFEWVMALSHRHPRTQVITGVKTGAVAPSIASHFYLSPHAEPILNTQKLLLVTHYAIKDTKQTLMTLNMHAINFVSVRKYVEQLDQLTEALSLYIGPVLLAGDFNTWNPQRLGAFLEIMAANGLQEAVMDRRSRLAHLNQHLDHVFYRGMTLRSVHSLGLLRSSDHAPITATFELWPGANSRDPVA